MKEILRFELRWQTSQRVFPFAALSFFAFGFLLIATGFGPARVALLAPYNVAQATGFLALLGVFPAAIFTSLAVLRDEESRMTDLFFATPIGDRQYLISRFAGALAATSLVVALGQLGMIAASFLPGQPAERLAPIEAPGFLLALAVIALPAIAFSAALLFALAILTRSSLATGVGAIALYFLYWGAAAFTNSPLLAASKDGDGSALAVAAWLDPFGLSSFFSSTLFWTAAEQNHRLPYDGTLVAQRALTLALAAGLFFLTEKFFRRQGRQRGGVKAPRRATAGAAWPWSPGAVWSSRIALELRHLAAGWPLWAAFALWLLLAGLEIASDLYGGEYGAARLPSTAAIVSTLEQPFLLFGLVVLVFFGAELLWLDAAAGIEPVVDATPTPAGAWVLAKFLVLATLVGGLGLFSVALGLAFQLLHPSHRFEPLLYLQFLFFSGAPLLIFGAATLFLHRVAKNRHIGLFASLLLALWVLGGGNFGLEHPLLRFAQTPPVEYSSWAGLGGSGHGAAALLAYWGLFASLLLLAAASLWRRGEKPDWRRRRGLLAAGAIAFLLAGGAIFYQTNLVQAYQSSDARLAFKAEYERRYRQLAAGAQPRPAMLEARLDLFPAERRALLAGSYRLENRSSDAIPVLWLNLPREARVLTLSSPQAAAVEPDREFAVFRLPLRQPLAAGHSLELDFQLEIAEAGLQADGGDFAVIDNGSYLALWRYLPAVGYRQAYEIRDRRERRRRQLAELPSRAEVEAGHGEGEATDWVDFEIEVTTAGDQLVAGSGRLVRQWQEGERAHFLFDSAGAPVPNALAYASARYQVLRREGPAGAVAVYSSGRQPDNAEKVQAFAAAALEDFAAMFRRPYPFATLQLAELPAFWPFGGFATPGAIFLVEHRSFELDTRPDGGIDLLGRRVAHEVAHQWWGHALSPATGPGASVLVESLAKYSELELLAKLHGNDQVRCLLEAELERYLKGRGEASQDEVPLVAVDHEAFLFYGKGAIATHAIAAALGRAAFHEALAALLDQQAGAGRSPQIGDLLAELEARADPAGRALIDELLRRIVLHDFALVDVTATAGGLELVIEAGKWQADGRGEERPLDFKEELEIALEYEGGEEIHRVSLVPGSNRLLLPTAVRATAVQLDPNVLFLDTRRFNNRRNLPLE